MDHARSSLCNYCCLPVCLSVRFFYQFSTGCRAVRPLWKPQDVSRFAGVFEHVFETVTAGVTLQSPQLDINTVAAGGGSRLFFRSGLFAVG